MKALSNTAIAAIFALGVALLVGGSLAIPLFGDLEAKTSDGMMLLRYWLHQKYTPLKPDTHLVLAAIDEKSTQELGAWPFPRSVHGQFLQVLAPENPKTVAWDIFFTEAKSITPSSTSTPSPTNDANAQPPLPQSPTDDETFLQGVALFPHMITASARSEDPVLNAIDGDLLPTKPFKNVTGSMDRLLSSDYAIVPFPALRKISYFGFADDPGDVRRTMPLVINLKGKLYPSFDLQVLMQFWDVDPDQVTIAIGQDITIPKPDGTLVHIPIDKTGCLILNYRAHLEDFQAMGYSTMGLGLDNKAQNQPSDAAAHLPPLHNNIVIVGFAAVGFDSGPNPLDATAPLVVTHLTALNNILQGDFLHPVNVWIWMPIYALFLFGIGNLMLRSGIPIMISIALVSIVFLAAMGFAVLWFGNFLVPVAMPEIGLLVLSICVPSKGFFGEEREKTRIKNALRTYLSEKIMTKVLEHPDNVKLGGMKQEISIMFCDIRGFTQYCDERDPQETVEVLNEYMEAMTQVVFKYDGTIDKYIGDCIMAFWNAPQPQPDHAQRAVCCAMEMRYALANFKTKRAGIDRELFECGIGIHTGEALVGNMGSSLKSNYTAMGSTVNMAARLESLTKRLNERILISQNVLDQLQGDFPLTDRGEAVVPGFANPIHVYAVVADQNIAAALNVGQTLAGQQEYTAEDASHPIWEPAPLPEDADPNP